MASRGTTGGPSFGNNDLAHRKFSTGERNAPARARQTGEADKGGSRERRGRVGGLELEMPVDRRGEACFGYAQHDWHGRIAGASAERDLQIQGIDVGHRDQAVRSTEIAQIECRVAAGIPGQQVEALLARPFDDGRIGRDLDDDQMLAESEEQIDHLAADAAGTANDDMSAPGRRPCILTQCTRVSNEAPKAMKRPVMMVPASISAIAETISAG